MRRLGLTPYLDFVLTAAEVGAEKPAPEMFAAALQRAAARPGEAVHVGDQPRSDVLGARAAGIYPILLDRGGWQTGVTDCVRISGLAELEPLLAAAPAAATGNGNRPLGRAGGGISKTAAIPGGQHSIIAAGGIPL